MIEELRELLITHGMSRNLSDRGMLEWLDANFPTPNTEHAAMDVVKRERSRIVEIMSLCRDHNIGARDEREWIDSGISAGDVVRKILSRVATV